MKGLAGEGSGGALLVEGIVAGTRIATPGGWRRVEALRPGDRVRTRGAGVQVLTEARSAQLSCLALPPALWPLLVPSGALACREPMLLLPDQRVLVDLGRVADLLDVPVALIPAAALDGWRGMRRVCPPPGLRAMTLAFAAPQLVHAGAAMFLSCPGGSRGTVPEGPAMLSLSLEQARHAIACLIAQELGCALQRRRV